MDCGGPRVASAYPHQKVAAVQVPAELTEESACPCRRVEPRTSAAGGLMAVRVRVQRHPRANSAVAWCSQVWMCSEWGPSLKKSTAVGVDRLVPEELHLNEGCAGMTTVVDRESVEK